MNMNFWIKTAWLFLFRSKRSTSALGLMIFFAVGTLVFITAIAVGINDSMIRNSTGLYSGHITGFDLPKTLARDTLLVDGVSDVLQRFQIQGSLHNQEKKEMLTLIAVNPDQEKKVTALWKKIIKGNYIADNEFEILISRATAKKIGVHPGENIIFRSGSAVYCFVVAGIFKTGIERLDHGIAFCPVSILPDLPANWDGAVFLDSGADMKGVVESYARKGLKLSHLKTWKELMPDLTQLIELNRISMGFVMVLVLGVVSFGTACAFAIFIISNIREYGIMKAMGVTPKETTMLIIFEVILMNLAASFAGTLAGSLVVLITSRTGIDLSSFTSYNQYFVVSGLIIPRLTPFLLFLPGAIALSFCLLASIWPAMIVIRQRTADILRSI
ncbi:MAG: FtsX-like permease family protein [Desulfobacula sp.]|nr:FtsX-like permease family protein [Desulfobacula sp.]